MYAEWRECIPSLEQQSDSTKNALEPMYPFVHGIGDKPKLLNVSVNLRGNPHTLGDEVPRRFLAVLSPDDQQPFTKGSGGLEFANDIFNSPIAARGFVNPVLKWHFGNGIFGPPDNFGVAGEKPSKPNLPHHLS